jgi:REP element-mobilizing transposase RayT
MMWRAHNKEHILKSHHEKTAYLRAVRDDRLSKSKEDDFEIHGYTVMGNHVHINGAVGESYVPYSNHMRRSHSIFGLGYNKRHNRIGKVAHDRPKMKASRDESDAIGIMLYDHYNPVRAGIVPHATHVKYRLYSSARYMAFGEKNEFTNMVTLPSWYLALGKTPQQRQRRYRQMLDEYMIEKGMKQDPKKTVGYFIGSSLWVQAMRRQVRQWIKDRKKINGSASRDPPDPTKT